MTVILAATNGDEQKLTAYSATVRISALCGAPHKADCRCLDYVELSAARFGETRDRGPCRQMMEF